MSRSLRVQIRAHTVADAEALARAGSAAFEAAFRGLVPDQCLNDPTPEESVVNWNRTLAVGGMDPDQFLLVAEDGAGQVVGYAMACPRPDDPLYQAELTVLAVSPTHQRQGIGRRLVSAVAERLTEAGLYSLRVTVVSINPSRPFYERLGGEYLGEEPLDWNGVMVTEAVYGWRDTAPLIDGGYDGSY